MNEQSTSRNVKLHWARVAVELVVALAMVCIALEAHIWEESTGDRVASDFHQQVGIGMTSTRAKIAAETLPFLKCNSPLWKMSYHILTAAAPEYAVDADNFSATCPGRKSQATLQQEAALRNEAQTSEIRLAFLSLWASAKEYRQLGLDSDAATEYARAYNAMPSEYATLVDYEAAENGRVALAHGRFREAVDKFVLAFARIPTP